MTNHEYAKFTSILKCPKVTIAYDVDVPGVVPHGAHPTIPDIDGPDVGNGEPPDFALDVQIHGRIHLLRTLGSKTSQSSTKSSITGSFKDSQTYKKTPARFLEEYIHFSG